MKSDVFKKELGYIEYEEIRNFTILVLEELPNYFYQVAASSTRKYHPNYALGEGGLVRHTKAAVGIAKELFNCNIIQRFTTMQKDIIISALLLHDGFKQGLNSEGYTTFQHPLICVEYIQNNKKIKENISSHIVERICECIKSHMGQWNTSKYSDRILPLPETESQKFVHLCDYLASRKCLEFNFEV